MIRKIFRKLLLFISNAISRRILLYQGVELGDNVIVNGLVYVKNLGSISIGDNVVINSGARFNPVGGQTFTRIIVYPGGILRIGNSAGISNSTIVVQSEVIIGCGTLIGGSCNIWDTDFHSCDAAVRGTAFDQGKSKPIHVGDHAFIGAHSILLKGSKVGSRAIVGAGSVGCLKVADDQMLIARQLQTKNKVLHPLE
jgi:acetyltransferase-like isoleucine patch superfamily enzyme